MKLHEDVFFAHVLSHLLSNTPLITIVIHFIYKNPSQNSRRLYNKHIKQWWFKSAYSKRKGRKPSEGSATYGAEQAEGDQADWEPVEALQDGGVDNLGSGVMDQLELLEGDRKESVAMINTGDAKTVDKDRSSADSVGEVELDCVAKVAGSSLGDVDMGIRMPPRFLT